MALKQLTEEQVRDWTLEQKDRWWFDNVWRGNMPQLTLRAALTGMILGSVLSLTNMYIGAKTGWNIGVGITSVILAFALYKVFSRLGIGREFTVLENNCMQSIATAAGYTTGPLTSSLAAYMIITGAVIPMHATIIWIVALAVLGVLFAFPLKRRFINDEQHPFPEGRAAGVVMDALHTGDASEGLLKAKILAAFGGGAALLKLASSQAAMDKIKLGFLTLPEYLDEWFYALSEKYLGWIPRILGTDLRELTVRPDSDFVMMAAGGLMGIRTGVSLLVGAIVNYVILAPLMIQRGDIHGKVVDGVVTYGFKSITTWALWCGVAVMTTASLFAFFSRPKVLIDSFRGLMGRGGAKKRNDVLRGIELPMRVFVIGIPVVGGVVVYLAHRFFGVEIWHGIVAIPLIFLFTLIAVNSTALTSITPTGALGKLTQLTFSVLAPKNITTNIASAGIAAEVSTNASNLLMDIKPGYMLGAKPRQQAIGHVLGIISGCLVSVPVFYLVFLKGGPQGLINDKFPMPSATVWEAVARLLTKGLGELAWSAQVAAIVGALAGILLEAFRIATRNRSWVSGVGVGLAFVIPFNTCLAMFMGSFLFWLAGRRWKNPGTLRHKVFVQNLEPVCAGVIAGGALMGIVVILLESFVLQ